MEKPGKNHVIYPSDKVYITSDVMWMSHTLYYDVMRRVLPFCGILCSNLIMRKAPVKPRLRVILQNI